MAKVRSLTDSTVNQNKRQVRTYGTKTDLSSTTVERGNTHWAEGSNVNIDGFLGVAGTATVSGTLRVTGLLDVTGTFNGSGTNNLDGTNNLSGDNNLTGPTEISGSLDVTGPTTIDGVLTINGDTSITGLLEVTGNTTISGTLDIDGVTTLNNDLNVTNSGEINVGTNMTLTPSSDGGSIVFQDGSQVTSVGGTVQAKSSGSGRVTAGLNSAAISTGNALISVDDLGDWSLSGANVTFQTIGGTADLNGNLDVSGNITHPGIEVIGDKVKIVKPYTGSAQPNVHMDANGYLYRTSWTPA